MMTAEIAVTRSSEIYISKRLCLLINGSWLVRSVESCHAVAVSVPSKYYKRENERPRHCARGLQYDSSLVRPYNLSFSKSQKSNYISEELIDSLSFHPQTKEGTLNSVQKTAFGKGTVQTTVFYYYTKQKMKDQGIALDGCSMIHSWPYNLSFRKSQISN